MSQELKYRFGITLRHAGVAITITSVTDLLAFGIGATTILPALQSFCLFAAFGILFVFLYMVTFFLAFFSLDQRRIESFRNCCCCCYVHKDWEPNACSQKSFLDMAFVKYANILVTIPFKVIVLIFSVSVLSVAAYGVSELKAEFKVTVFLNEGTYLREYFDVNAEKFPGRGINGDIYVAESPNVHQNIKEIMALIDE